jgi:hypothetical protein
MVSSEADSGEPSFNAALEAGSLRYFFPRDRCHAMCVVASTFRLFVIWQESV